MATRTSEEIEDRFMTEFMAELQEKHKEPFDFEIDEHFDGELEDDEENDYVANSPKIADPGSRGEGIVIGENHKPSPARKAKK